MLTEPGSHNLPSEFLYTYPAFSHRTHDTLVCRTYRGVDTQKAFQQDEECPRQMSTLERCHQGGCGPKTATRQSCSWRKTGPFTLDKSKSPAPTCSSCLLRPWRSPHLPWRDGMAIGRKSSCKGSSPTTTCQTLNQPLEEALSEGKAETLVKHIPA